MNIHHGSPVSMKDKIAKAIIDNERYNGYKFEYNKSIIPVKDLDMDKIKEYKASLIEETAAKLSAKYICDIKPEHIDVKTFEMVNKDQDYELIISVDIPVYFKPIHLVKGPQDNIALSEYIENDEDKLTILNSRFRYDDKSLEIINKVFSKVFPKIKGFPAEREIFDLVKYNTLSGKSHVVLPDLTICGKEITSYSYVFFSGLITEIGCPNCILLIKTFGYSAFSKMEAL